MRGTQETEHTHKSKEPCSPQRAGDHLAEARGSSQVRGSVMIWEGQKNQ